MPRNDPVHEFKGMWYFWNETWDHREGPFVTEQQARDACDRYTIWLEEKEYEAKLIKQEEVNYDGRKIKRKDKEVG